MTSRYDTPVRVAIDYTSVYVQDESQSRSSFRPVATDGDGPRIRPCGFTEVPISPNGSFLRGIAFWVLALACLWIPQSAFCGTVTLDFDSVSLSPGSVTDATAYLASFGVTFTPLTPNTLPAIMNTVNSGGPIASSPPNVFTLYGASGPQAVAYQLNFSAPLSSITFTAVAVQSNTGVAPWSATARDAANDTIGTVSDGFLLGPAAQTFTFTGAGITSLEIDARNDLTRTSFNSPPLDNLILVSTPEPGGSVLIASVLAALLLLRARACGAASKSRITR